jgi:hypothetical protein
MRFPAAAPAQVGTFTVQGKQVIFRAAPDASVVVSGQPVKTFVLHAYDEEGKTVLTLGTYSWYLIQRDGQLAIRLKDSASPVLAAFHGLEYYPTAAAWRVPAHFHRYTTPRTVHAPTALKRDTEIKVLGTLEFTVSGRQLTLEAFDEDEGSDLSLIFADQTNGHGSYPGGRYLTVASPDKDGNTIIDFNKAYNPPCAFTKFATCVYPTTANRLPIPVPAGEQFTGHD